jgi:hypothetical protein
MKTVAKKRSSCWPIRFADCGDEPQERDPGEQQEVEPDEADRLDLAAQVPGLDLSSAAPFRGRPVEQDERRDEQAGKDEAGNTGGGGRALFALDRSDHRGLPPGERLRSHASEPHWASHLAVSAPGLNSVRASDASRRPSTRAMNLLLTAVIVAAVVAVTVGLFLLVRQHAPEGGFSPPTATVPRACSVCSRPGSPSCSALSSTSPSPATTPREPARARKRPT